MAYSEQFESTIPILIIVLLVVGIIALNPGLVAGVPILGDLVKSPTINVLIIGEQASEANAWKTHLSGDLAMKVFGNPLNIEVMTNAEYNKISSVDWIKSQGYQTIILTAGDLTPAMQLTLKDWTRGGGKLLVLGTGGTQVNGRWAELGTILPVTCGPSGDCSGITTSVFAPTLYIGQGMFNNGLASKIDTATPLTTGDASINVANVNLETGHIIYIGGFPSSGEVTAGETGDVYPGISEAKAGTGKVVYISFNPTTENITPAVEQSIVINTMAYLMGASGYQST